MNIGIVGATGNVGRKIIEVIENKNISVNNLYCIASKKSAGSKLMFKGKEVIVDNSSAKGHTQPIIVHSKNKSKTDKTSAA